MDTKKADINTPQTQDRQPGRQREMVPAPVSIRESYVGSGKLCDRIALISGGDSGIGRAVALHFAREGANVAIVYLEENDDARDTRTLIEAAGRRCLLLQADLHTFSACQDVVGHVCREFGTIDILVNNAAEQHPVDDPTELTSAQIETTFATNVFSYLHLTRAVLPHMPEKGTIINTGSVTGTRGHATLIDYAATKGAIQSLTFSLAQALADRDIRVNAVAPGPIWTPLIPASFDADDVASFGSNTLMKRPGQPAEVAPAYVFLASDDASFITGQIIHVNGGGHIGA